MRVHRIPTLATALILLQGCAGVSPDPQSLARDLPPERSVDPAVAAQAAELGRQALELTEVQDYAAARLKAERALSLDPRAAQARAALAICIFADAAAEEPPNMSLLNQAEGEFLRAQKIAHEDPLIGMHHARFLAGLGHLNAAIARLEDLTELHPDDSRLLSALGQIHYDLGHERRAAEVLGRLLESNPEDALSHYLLAHCLLRLAPEFEKSNRVAEYQRAAAEFARYRELVPADIDGLLGEAHARFQALSGADEIDAARAGEILDLYNLALEKDSRLVEAWFSQGVVLDYLQRTEEAQASYQKALGVDSNHLPSLLNLAANLNDAGNAEAAKEYLRRAMAAGGLSSSERQRIEALLQK